MINDNETYYYFRVSDNGMSGDRIYSGDMVRIDRLAGTNESDIILILLPDLTQVIRRVVAIQRNKYMLIPSNKEFATMCFDFNVVFLGKVISTVVWC